MKPDTPIFTPPEPISVNNETYIYSVQALFSHFNQAGATAAAELVDLEKSGKYTKEWAKLQCIAAYAVKSGRILSALGATGCREISTSEPIEGGATFVKQRFSELTPST